MNNMYFKQISLGKKLHLSLLSQWKVLQFFESADAEKICLSDDLHEVIFWVHFHPFCVVRIFERELSSFREANYLALRVFVRNFNPWVLFDLLCYCSGGVKMGLTAEPINFQGRVRRTHHLFGCSNKNTAYILKKEFFEQLRV